MAPTRDSERESFPYLPAGSRWLVDTSFPSLHPSSHHFLLSVSPFLSVSFLLIIRALLLRTGAQLDNPEDLVSKSLIMSSKTLFLQIRSHSYVPDGRIFWGGATLQPPTDDEVSNLMK